LPSQPKIENRSSHREDSTPRDVTRHVSAAIQCMLWGKAAGRCEFEGCNLSLWKSSVTQESVNIAQKSHIYSFSGIGPRGHGGLDSDEINDISNLMLVCHGCHRKLDQYKDGGRYTAERLQEWKKSHERRIEIVTGIATEKRSHVLLYGANIGEHTAPLSYRRTAPALFPHAYPASDVPVQLGTVNSAFVERDAEFWNMEGKNLVRKVRQSVKERIATADINHLSVFALAPQPLLILLGTLLGDIVPADVYQLHREPAGWTWPEVTADVPTLEIIRPLDNSGPPALVVALSGTVTPDRVFRAMGEPASVWSISTSKPHNDFIKTKEQLSEFRCIARSLFEEIKAVHGNKTVLHVFPVAAVSVAVEFGRVRMPKADMPWRIYDQVNDCGGFVAALDVPFGDN